MKIGLNHELLKIMRYSLLSLLVLFISSGLLIASPGMAQKLKGTKISVNFDNETLDACINKISLKSDIGFAYNPEQIRHVLISHASFRNVSVYRILHALLDDTDLSIKELNNHIVVYRKSEPPGMRKKVTVEGGRTYTAPVATINALNNMQLLINDLSTDVSGTVTDRDGTPVAGVSIIVKGTGTGTVTDENGAYHLQVSGDRVTLEFSFLGYETQEIKVTGSVVNISLNKKENKLDEVVVVGYGNQKRVNVTGAISSVSGKEIENLPVNDLAGALQGRVAGVVVTQGDGGPGSGADIIIRGAASINGLGPMYVVDGVPLGTGNNFNIQDVQSVEVLKDASSAAIYGVGAAGGVILVTTKHGSNRGNGKPVINFYGNYGTRKAVNLYHLLNTNDFLTAKKAIGTDVSGWGDPATLPNTDWMKVLYGNGKEQNYTLSVSGGSNRVNYYVSGNYERQDGIKVGTWFDRYGLRFNSDFQIIDNKLKIGVNTYTWKTSNNPDAGDGTMPFRTVPTMKVYDPTNPLGGWGKQPPGGYYNGDNPYATQMINHYNNDNYGEDANVYLNWNIIKGLSFKTTIAASIGGSSSSHFTEAYNYGTLANPLGTFSKSISLGQGFLSNYTLTYDRNFGNHHLTVLAGYEARKGTGTDLNGNTVGFNATVAQSFQLSTTANGSRSVDGSVGDSRVLSQFGRLNYDFKGKYLLTASIRRDGEDKFGPENKWGVFPSISGGWRLSEEDFIKNSLPGLSNLKIRGGYGALGNDGALGQFLYQPSYSSLNINAFSPGDRSQGWGLVIFPNAAIKWEEVDQTDIGVDLGLLQNRLTFTADWYSRQTHNMIYNVSTPPSAGIGNYNGAPAQIPVNIGQVSNKGFELAIGYTDNAGDFQYSINANASFNTNKVLKLGFDTIPILNGGAGPGGVWNGPTSITQVGHPMGAFYGYQADGIFKSDAEAASSVQPNAHAGDLRYRDLNKDGAISSADQTYIGNPWPKMVYAFNVNLSWKNFDLQMLFTGVQGVDIYNGNKATTESLYGDYNTTRDIFKTSFFNGNGLTNLPSVGHFDNGTPPQFVNDPNGNYKNISSFFIENGSYLKLKNLQIGYNLPKKMLQNIKLSSVRIYLMADNLFTITKYTGIDPELAGGVTQRGIDNIYVYPHTRLISAGLNIGM